MQSKEATFATASITCRVWIHEELHYLLSNGHLSIPPRRVAPPNHRNDRSTHSVHPQQRATVRPSRPRDALCMLTGMQTVVEHRPYENVGRCKAQRAIEEHGTRRFVGGIHLRLRSTPERLQRRRTESVGGPRKGVPTRQTFHSKFCASNHAPLCP